MWKELLPYLSQAMTIIVAVVAIAFTRISSRESVNSQLRQKMWEKKAETYVEIIRQTTRADPHNGKTPEGYMREAAQDPGGEVRFLPVDTDDREWQDFEARVEAFASPEVRYLYSLWMSAVAGWTWTTSKSIVHADRQSEHHEVAKQERHTALAGVFAAHQELIAQIRAELRFEKRELKNIKYRQVEGFFDAIVGVEVDWSRHDTPTPIRASRLLTIRRFERNGAEGWKHTIALGERHEPNEE
ncbi:hypothetical protein [Nonomuraea angiospora]|uniref:hypothetical protein n=1 Tax=Nonomuraea angiospora TaxID=46172 RepID=UPI0029B1F855|nr:hypothetical protein [Nonomuraea angiospora]MDX3101624.1 hypothetical protein [Nonomuraea angiospora]